MCRIRLCIMVIDVLTLALVCSSWSFPKCVTGFCLMILPRPWEFVAVFPATGYYTELSGIMRGYSTRRRTSFSSSYIVWLPLLLEGVKESFPWLYGLLFQTERPFRAGSSNPSINFLGSCSSLMCPWSNSPEQNGWVTSLICSQVLQSSAS